MGRRESAGSAIGCGPMCLFAWTARRTNKSVIDENKTTNPLEALTKKQQLSLCWTQHAK